MKLDNIYDVLKANLKKGCNIHYLGGCIEDSESCSKIYEECMSYCEFEKRILNMEGDSIIVYGLISMYGKDSDYHWYRIRELFGDRCFKTYSDVGSLLVGNESFQVLIPNGMGDGTTRVAVFKKDDDVPCGLIDLMMDSKHGPTLRGKFNIYSYDCDKPEVDEPCKTLEGRYLVYYYDGFVAFVEY
mgnify:CR=1 FL=1|jgi:hypothetical protein